MSLSFGGHCQPQIQKSLEINGFLGASLESWQRQECLIRGLEAWRVVMHTKSKCPGSLLARLA